MVFNSRKATAEHNMIQIAGPVIVTTSRESKLAINADSSGLLALAGVVLYLLLRRESYADWAEA
jgi:uncharacterized protein (TIGR03382 family)